MPIYEYACRECGGRFEQVRRVQERLSGPACPACSAETVLVMSTPGHVGAGVAGGAVPACDTGGGCCGGGCAN